MGDDAMRYLYGDSTTSSLTSNVLEYLRDAIDVAVYMLEADTRIRRGRDHIDALRQNANVDIGELDTLGRSVAATLAAAPRRASDSPVVQCTERMSASCNDALRLAVEAVQARLDADISLATTEEG